MMTSSIWLEKKELFEIFYLETKRGLRGKFFASGINNQHLDDCLQQSFLEVLIKNKKIRFDIYNRDEIKSYIIRRAYWRMLDKRRKHSYIIEDSIDSLIDILDANTNSELDNPEYIVERKLIMQQRLKRLSARQQEIVIKIAEGWDRLEIAQVLNVSKYVVDKEYSRAIIELKKAFDDE